MQKTKRFLFVITQADWGGAQTFLFNAAREAVRRGNEVLLVAGGEGLLEAHAHEANVPYRRLVKMRREISPFHDIGATRELASLMREWRPDAVLLVSSKAGMIGSIAARLARVPRVVYRIGGWSFLDPVSPAQKAFRRWSEKLTAGFKDVIIVVHPGDAAVAQKIGITPREQMVTIPNGLDLAAFDASLLPRDEARKKLTDTSAPLLLTIANFYPAKGLASYIDALALVHAQRPDVRAMIIGDGELRSTLEAKRREYELEDVLSLPGQMSDASRLLKGADIFVLPSLKEGMSWSVLEAMAARIPLVATDVGANQWMLGDSNKTVPPGNAQALADAILNALQNPDDAHRRAEVGRTIIETRFTETPMWEATFRVLEK